MEFEILNSEYVPVQCLSTEGIQQEKNEDILYYMYYLKLKSNERCIIFCINEPLSAGFPL